MNSLKIFKISLTQIANILRIRKISNLKIDRLTEVLYLFTAQWKYKSYSNIEIHKTQIMALEMMLEVMPLAFTHVQF